MAAFAGFERAALFFEPPLELRAGHDSIIQQIGCADRIIGEKGDGLERTLAWKLPEQVDDLDESRAVDGLGRVQ
jgi:hypothetical protein